MLQLNTKKRFRLAGIITMLGIISLSSLKCKKNPTEPEDLTSTVIIANICGADVDFFLDGEFLFFMENESDETIDPITPGERGFEAKLTGTETLVYSRTIDVETATDYIISIEGPSKILVTNSYGEILKIYMDGSYVGDIGLNLTQTIYKVRFGTRELEARKRSDDTVVATISFDVTEVADLVWVITP